MSGSPGRVEGRSGSSRAFWMRSSSRFAKPRSVSAPSAVASRASATTFSRLAIWRLAAARARERRQDARLVVEPLEQPRGRSRGAASGAARSSSRSAGAIAAAPGRARRSAPAHSGPPDERVGDDVAVAHAEERRAQRRHERDAIARVVDRAQHRERLVHLLAVEEGLAALDREAQPRRLERLLERLDPRQAPRQHQHVAGAARPHAAASPGRAPSRRRARSRPGTRRGRGLGREQVVARGIRRRPGSAAPRPSGSSGSPGGGAIASYAGLVGLVGGLDQPLEDPVDEAQDRRPRAEVLGEVKHTSRGQGSGAPPQLPAALPVVRRSRTSRTARTSARRKR